VRTVPPEMTAVMLSSFVLLSVAGRALNKVTYALRVRTQSFIGGVQLQSCLVVQQTYIHTRIYYYYFFLNPWVYSSQGLKAKS